MFDAGKISQAVTDCLHQCYASGSPLEALAEFKNMLARDPNWSEYETEAVEIRVLRVLNRIISEPTDSHFSATEGSHSPAD